MRSVRQLILAAFLPVLAAADAAPPVPEPSWQPCGWGGGAFYYAVAWHPTAPDQLYLGGDCAGAYRSEDHARSWRFANVGIDDYAVFAFGVSPAAPDEVWMLTEGGLCKSTDRARTWHHIAGSEHGATEMRATKNRTVRAISPDPVKAGVVYVGSRTGKVFKTEDDGDTWHELAYAPAPEAGAKVDAGVVASVVVSPREPALVFVANDRRGLFRSEDGGATWKAVADDHRPVHVAVDPGDPTSVWAACGATGLLHSTDRGLTWSVVKPDAAGKLQFREVVPCAGKPARIYALAALDWGGRLLRSDDGGQTWTASPTIIATAGGGDPTLPQEPPQLSSIKDLAVNPANPDELVIAGNWRIVASSDGGKTFSERSTGADNTCATDIQFANGKTWVTAMDEGLFASADDGASWKQVYPLKYDEEVSGHFWRVRVSGAAGAEHVVATSSPWKSYGSPSCVNRVFVSADSGASFEKSTFGLPKYIPTPNTMWGRSFPRALATDPKDPQVLYLAMDGDPEPDKKLEGGGVFRSADGGATWKRCAGQPGGRRMYYGLAVDPTDPRRVFYSSCGTGGGAWRSEDQGATWTQVFAGDTWSFNLEVAPSGRVLVGGTNLNASDDHGQTWKQLTSFKGPATIVGIAVDPADEHRMWISSTTWSSNAREGGIWRTVDGGATWTEITGDIPYRKPQLLRYDPRTHFLWAGGVGLYRIAQ